MANTKSKSDKPRQSRDTRFMTLMNLVVLLLSLLLIIYISVESFTHVDFLQDRHYMQFQLWVCIVFMADFFIGLYFAPKRGRYFWSRIVFLLLSVPYLNIIHYLQIPVPSEALAFIRFVPLCRGALAMFIVSRYLSKSAVTSLFMSYIIILLTTTYFCSLIFYEFELGVNPSVTSYWLALWWTAMNITTVGCYINPLSTAAKIVATVLPICGMVVFPLFTVYLTDYVRRNFSKRR